MTPIIVSALLVLLFCSGYYAAMVIARAEYARIAAACDHTVLRTIIEQRILRDNSLQYDWPRDPAAPVRVPKLHSNRPPESMQKK